MNISIMGKTGSGKTTLSQLLESTTGMKHISSGDLIRKYLIDDKTTEELAMGHMAPDEDAVRKLVFNEIHTAGDDGYALDGFPRIIDQAHSLEKFGIDALIHLNVPDFVCINRLLDRKRSDDILELIETRLSLFYKHTLHIIDMFSEMNIPIININGNQSRGLVWSDTIVKLDVMRKATDSKAEKAKTY